MVAEPHDLMMEMLKRLHGRLDSIQGDMTDIKTRLTSMDTGQALMRQEMAQQSVLIAALNARMDRFDERVARIERRLDLIDA